MGKDFDIEIITTFNEYMTDVYSKYLNATVFENKLFYFGQCMGALEILEKLYPEILEISKKTIEDMTSDYEKWLKEA